VTPGHIPERETASKQAKHPNVGEKEKIFIRRSIDRETGKNWFFTNEIHRSTGTKRITAIANRKG
jgi:hypothetical protein